MNSWKEFGAVVSDPRPGDDTPLWDELLSNAAAFDAQLYVKLIGLRLAGAELLPSARFGLRLVMANEATVTQQEARELLAPHSELLLNLFLHIGGGAGGQQKTDT